MNDVAWKSFQAGLELIDKKQFEFAISRMKEAITLFQRTLHRLIITSAWHMLIWTQKDLAIEAWQQTTTIAPYSEIAALSHDALVVALTHLDRLPEAIEHGRKAVRIAPDNAMMHFNLSVALMRAGKTGEGVSEMEEAVLNDPKSKELEMLTQAYDNFYRMLVQNPYLFRWKWSQAALEAFTEDFNRVNILPNPNWDLLVLNSKLSG